MTTEHQEIIQKFSVSVSQACESFRAFAEALSATLPRSFVSRDAMHWTPPAEGQEVPPWRV